MCCEAVRTLLKQDKIGQASLAMVKVISGMVKSRNYNVKPEVQSSNCVDEHCFLYTSFTSSVLAINIVLAENY